MIPNDPEAYARLGTGELEKLLRSSETPVHIQRLIREELAKRYTDDLLRPKSEQSASSTRSPQQQDSPQWETDQRPPEQSRAVGQPQAALPSEEITTASTPPTGSSFGGCALLIIAILVGLILIAYMGFQRVTDPPLGTKCVLGNGDYCELPFYLPPGSTCQCSVGGLQYSGSTQ
jgi:hypothetical protein